jgi:hypothetical protein
MDFEMMSAELLGGAPLPPMSPQERQQYINGITIKAKVSAKREREEGEGRWAARSKERKRTNKQEAREKTTAEDMESTDHIRPKSRLEGSKRR